MKNQIATTADTAIQITHKQWGQSQADFIINKHIDKIFGKDDNSYFLKASQLRTDMKDRTFRITLIEDCDGEHHQLYFQLIQEEQMTTLRG